MEIPAADLNKDRGKTLLAKLDATFAKETKDMRCTRTLIDFGKLTNPWQITSLSLRDFITDVKNI
jgi:hypothetical protein